MISISVKSNSTLSDIYPVKLYYMPPPLTETQIAVMHPDKGGRIFVEGPAGCGKTTAGAARLVALLESGVSGGEIMVLLPQRTLAVPYQDALLELAELKGSLPAIITLGGLARRMVDLYWPVVARSAGFADPTRPPVFLTLETAQYFMARAAAPLLEQGYFESLAIDRNRLYSQVLDNLNKAALVGFPQESYSERLKAAWIGLESQAMLYDQAQETATAFRTYCLAHNLLDFSLQLEVFFHQIWKLPGPRVLLSQTYRHLIYDNIEEDTPVAHDLVSDWLPDFDSALLICDRYGGFRSFLGADPVSAQRLKSLCQSHIEFTESFTTPPELAAWATSVSATLTRTTSAEPAISTPAVNAISHRYQPEMVSWTVDEIERMIHEEKQAPGGIAILAPILGGTLRFLLVEELERRGIAAQSHRPSRSLREEPAAECLLTLAALAHPGWGITPTAFELQKCLTQAVEGLDPVRAHLLTKIVYRKTKENTNLVDFEGVTSELRERITYSAGNRFDHLKHWLEAYQAETPLALDHFISRLFGEVLSQPGFGFHRDPAGGATAASLVESIRKFRSVLSETGEELPDLGPEYITMLKQGVLAAQYLGDWNGQRPDAVWISPATTFLMRNQPVDIQFWLDIGNQAWWERLYQPLTHPHVLSRNWQPDARWSEQNELDTNRAVLARLVNGLIRRCRRKLYINYSELSSQGYDQRSPFLHAIQRSLQTQVDV
jgi:hypothetical protein